MKASNLVRAIAAAAVAAALAPAVSAQSVSGGVDVEVTLNSKCRVQAGANPVIDFGNYDALDDAGKNLPGAATVTFQCTRGFGGTPVAAWDTTNGAADGKGVLAGLQYTLTAAGARTGGTAASTTSTGSPDLVNYTVNAVMPGGQAGAAAGATLNDSHTRTLLVTF